ncbi:alpha/beta hydrolase [Desulfosporosinus lacus]|uniref:Alpha/beta hydrolase family protein n=1 Tax=Desulfosporosinus lacus DSM 15449 TaxID=1121420 RepID=A0A1M6F902_9FIRM|nr:alpha/beta hydrolase [Desulfosporosinus lacus]SHI94234.1 Alpha/beta hydrolase family protein [Desulfosporosinus lacus DSM 15449]
MKNKVKSIRKLLRKIWILCGIIFTILLFVSFQAKGVDKTLLQSNDAVKVVNDSIKIEFTPLKDLNTSALLFYPGGLVDPKAYVPLARKISENGYKVIIVKLPFRIAFLESQKNELFSLSKELIQRYDEVNHWIVAGHSRGGALAAEFVKDENKLMDGLILMGTTHPKEFDLSNLNIDVTKILATNDGLASEKENIEYANNLPAHTNWVKIEGGNHSQFGYYSFQIGDNKATISRDEQQILLANSIIQVLQRVASK